MLPCKSQLKLGMSKQFGMDISSRGMCQAGPLHCLSLRHSNNVRRAMRPSMRLHIRAAIEEQDRGKPLLFISRACNCPAVNDVASHPSCIAGGEPTPESLFMKELRRRGLSDSKLDRGVYLPAHQQQADRGAHG